MNQEPVKPQKNKFLETVESIGIALLIALAIRSFVIEPFKIPSPSMVPTLLIGDQIFVNKFVYGIRIPFTKKRVWEGRDPKRGEVIVFMFPENEKLDFIKRVVGLPGDTVYVEEDRVVVNGEEIAKEALNFTPDSKDKNQVFLQPSKPYSKMTLFPEWEGFKIYREALGKDGHLVQYDQAFNIPKEFKVPEGHYFVMGDSRDHSDDSRRWGFVPRENIKGGAMFIWLSFDWDAHFKDLVRWHRFGRWIY